MAFPTVIFGLIGFLSIFWSVVSNSIILCVHTHLQGIIRHDNKAVLNLGAVGVSLHSGGKAQFMFVTGEEEVWKHECISLDYDEEQVITDFSNLHESAIKKFCEIRGCKLL